MYDWETTQPVLKMQVRASTDVACVESLACLCSRFACVHGAAECLPRWLGQEGGGA